MLLPLPGQPITRIRSAAASLEFNPDVTFICDRPRKNRDKNRCGQFANYPCSLLGVILGLVLPCAEDLLPYRLEADARDNPEHLRLAGIVHRPSDRSERFQSRFQKQAQTLLSCNQKLLLSRRPQPCEIVAGMVGGAGQRA
ncbi:hypothetical protein RPHASCH2410_CH02610 [Rhizobium phaseoli Ch24-10]|nr:hypothetical protein RPHASCH2410_CH02610 [Rhizobium phaseoli Ch24-10]